MKRKSWQRRRGSAELFVDELFAEGLSDRPSDASESSGRHRSKDERKAMQLCRQVQRALSLALAGECDDDVLRTLFVESVVPAPDASHLLVQVALPVSVEEVTSWDVLARLDRARGVLRYAITQAITRKRSPELSFIVVTPREVTP